MKRILFIPAAAILIMLSISCQEKSAYNALIVTGQNSSSMELSSKTLKNILEGSGLFSATIKKSPAKGSDMNSFNPDFAKYNLVVIDYSGADWSEKTKNAFVDYVKNGGGVLICQSAGIAFPGWKEYGEISGVTGGQTGAQAKIKEFEVRVRNSENPITIGLPVRWMHTKDILNHHLSSPAGNTEILATTYCDTLSGGSGREEPVLITVTYGKGRVFHTTLGYAEMGNDTAMKCSGFITTFQRGAEWAATGNVTQTLPSDFPNAAGVVVREGIKPLTLKEDFAGIVNYQINKSTRYLTGIEEALRNAHGNPQELLNIEKMIVDVLKNSNATVESKKLMLHELSWMGSDYCVPSVKQLVTDPELKDAAEFAIERMKAK